MNSKLFTALTLCSLMISNCYADKTSTQACRDCDDRDRFIVAEDTSKSFKKCPCEGNRDSEQLLTSSSSSSSADSFSTESFSSFSSSSIGVV